MTETFEYDPLTDTTIIHTTQDVSAYLDNNKAHQNEFEDRKRLTSEFDLYASIPAGIIHKWLIEEGLNVFDKNHYPRVFRKLNDPEYRHLKTTKYMHRVK